MAIPRIKSSTARDRSGDIFRFDISQNGAVAANLGVGYDTVAVLADDPVAQVRLTFTSSEVGNANANDSNTLANQDGGLAVRVQAEGADGGLTGPVSRFDDEGISFVSDGSFTFDVRDLVSGAARGDQFLVARLGTSAADRFNDSAAVVATYINAGMGDDAVFGGSANDFLGGGAGNDRLTGGAGADSFIGGLGDDSILGNADDDLAIYNISTDGSDSVDLGTGLDTVNVAAAVTTSQIRLTFTSSEVGNDNANDTGTLLNQDGGLAVRMQAEDGTGALAGVTSRYDDEGVTFVSTGAFTFDVRDLVSGAARGDQFKIVQLGTAAADMIDRTGSTLATYVNAGMGNDVIIGGDAANFLVGGAGDDSLTGSLANDSFIGGLGNDLIVGGAGADVAIVNVSTDGADTVRLGGGLDTVNVGAAAGTSQVRLTFTSAEVGNQNFRDGDTLANQDGGLAVRVQAEASDGSLTGTIGRYDDEGVRFVSTLPGMTFEVRDLVSGVSRGDQFAVAQLGTLFNDRFDESAGALSVYVNAGAGNDVVKGSQGSDFLVGNVGNDRLDGSGGNDSLLGGLGSDVFAFSGDPGSDTILDFVSGTDKIDFSAYGIGSDAVETRTDGANTIVAVDLNGDNAVEFEIVLTNVGAPAAGDYIFASTGAPLASAILMMATDLLV